MGNIRNYNFNYLDLKLSNSDYWDMYLTKDDTNNGNCDDLMSGSCFVVWYDFNNSQVYSGGNIDTIYSLVTWDGAINTGYTFDTIGLTGIDNGLVTFDKQSGDTTNLALLSALTGNYIYPLERKFAGPFFYTNFDGGFYQGFYKIDGYSYEVLPVRVEHSWSAEFLIRNKPEPIGITGETLNSIYPDNKGFFFYMGTRAENKFWNQWSGDCSSDCITISGCSATTFCTIPRETEISIVGDYGVPIPLNPPQINIDLITNPFLIYGRARTGGPLTYSLTGNTFIITTASTQTETGFCHLCGGPHDGLGNQTACSYDGNGAISVSTSTIVTNHTNPFLIYGRSTGHRFCCDTFHENDTFGRETTCSFSGFTSPETELDYKADIIDNALGFRIKDDGSIGYRLLTFTASCSGDTSVSGVTIEEKYSLSGMVNPDEWNYVVIKFVTDFKTECELKQAHPRKGKLLFYINAKLKFVVDDFDEFIVKRLNEYKDKQIGVPFNFSLGGGSQGLLESQTFGGRDQNDLGLEIERNFSGSFIGGIADFKFNICNLSYCNILQNYLYWNNLLHPTNYIDLEDDFLLTQEDGNFIIY